MDMRLNQSGGEIVICIQVKLDRRYSNGYMKWYRLPDGMPIAAIMRGKDKRGYLYRYFVYTVNGSKRSDKTYRSELECRRVCQRAAKLYHTESD